MKKSNKFLRTLAAITLCSIAALQNICANTEINIDQNTITVNFDASNPQKATVNIRGVTRVVDGVKNGIFLSIQSDPEYFYLLWTTTLF